MFKLEGQGGLISRITTFYNRVRKTALVLGGLLSSPVARGGTVPSLTWLPLHRSGFYQNPESMAAQTLSEVFFKKPVVIINLLPDSGTFSLSPPANPNPTAGSAILTP